MCFKKIFESSLKVILLNFVKCSHAIIRMWYLKVFHQLVRVSCAELPVVGILSIDSSDNLTLLTTQITALFLVEMHKTTSVY